MHTLEVSNECILCGLSRTQQQHITVLLAPRGAAREIRYAPPLYPCSMRAACDGSQTQRVRAWVCVRVGGLSPEEGGRRMPRRGARLLPCLANHALAHAAAAAQQLLLRRPNRLLLRRPNRLLARRPNRLGNANRRHLPRAELADEEAEDERVDPLLREGLAHCVAVVRRARGGSACGGGADGGRGCEGLGKRVSWTRGVEREDQGSC